MKVIGLAFCLSLAASGAGAADYADPDWPCLQPRVETLSAGLMWPNPVTPMPLPASATELVSVLSLRRVDMTQADTAIQAFLASQPSVDAQLIGNIFMGVFDTLSKDRHRLITGIVKYSQGQTDLATHIDAARTEIETLMATPAPDFDKVDKLEEQIDWDERIYKDRTKSLTYVCETPVLLEKRLYALAQLLIKYVPQ